MDRTPIALLVIALANVVVIVGCGGGPSGGCTPSADDCTGENICISGACESAFGRIYDVTDVTITVPSTDDTGAAWDALGGAPDPFVVVLVNGTAVGTSPTVNDAFGGIYSGPFAATLVAGGTLAIEVYDEDVTANDLMFTCTAAPVTAGLLRDRSPICSVGGYSVSFQIDPR